MNPTPAIPVVSGTIVVFSDLACPFAHVLLHRLRTARTRIGLDDDIRIDHHAFPIELLNRAPGTRHGSDSEIPVLGALEPDAGWQLWQGSDYHYPSTMLPAFEAVQAAKRQSLRASERLDAALRRSFWQHSRPISISTTRSSTSPPTLTISTPATWSTTSPGAPPAVRCSTTLLWPQRTLSP